MADKCKKCNQPIELHHPIIPNADPLKHDVTVDGKGNYVITERKQDKGGSHGR